MTNLFIFGEKCTRNSELEEPLSVRSVEGYSIGGWKIVVLSAVQIMEVWFMLFQLKLKDSAWVICYFKLRFCGFG